MSFGETALTKQLLADVLAVVAQSTTYTDFFVRLMHGLFKKHGLLMIDAASANMRQLESAYFERLIDAAPSIAQAVTATEAQFDKAGYGTPIMAQPNNANIFYVREGERFFLFATSVTQMKFKEAHLWTGAWSTSLLFSLFWQL